MIENGMIIDGTGNPGYYGSVGVEDGRLTVFRGTVRDVDATRTIDAAGLVICPGFIDMHAHSGLVLLADPLHEPKVRQGITTELIGVDGNSYAPFRSQEDFRRFVELNSGLDGNPALPGRGPRSSSISACSTGSPPSTSRTFSGIRRSESTP